MFGSILILRFNWRSGIWITFRDAGKHASPNGGWPESAVAGALGVRLGGRNSYHGIASFRNYLGEATRPLEIEDIKRTTWILNLTVMITIGIIGLVGLIGL